MSGTVNNVVQDAKVAGTFARSAGPVIILSIVIAILSVALIVSMVTAKVGTDRYTASDQAEFADDLKVETKARLVSQQKVNKEVTDKVDKIGRDVAVTKSKVTGMEKDLAEIKSILLRRGNG